MPAPIDQYLQTLQQEGAAGLAFLNARVPHRFTGVYQLQDGMLVNRHLFDKLGEAVPESLAVVPLKDSFCQFVLRDGVFITTNSGSDQRLDGHVYQGVVNTYHGIPLLNNQAELYGTLCHFDMEPMELPDGELEFLYKAARVLPAFLRS